MPTRILRDGILDSKAVNSLSESGEILYRRLMSIVDDYGRFEADPDLIRARCFPRQFDRWPTTRIAEVLVELRCLPSSTVDHGGSPLVTVYRSGSKRLLQINNFGQRVQNKPKYPGPDSPESTVVHRDSPESTVNYGELPEVTVIHGDSPSIHRDSPPSRSRSRVEDGVVVDTPQAAPAPEVPAKASRGTRFEPKPIPSEWEAFAAKKRGWDTKRTLEVYESFSDFWIAKAGSDGVKLNWGATWRNWVRNQKSDQPGFGFNSGPDQKSNPIYKPWVDKWASQRNETDV